MSDDRVLEHILNPSAPLTSEHSKTPDLDPVPQTEQVREVCSLYSMTVRKHIWIVLRKVLRDKFLS